QPGEGQPGHLVAETRVIARRSRWRVMPAVARSDRRFLNLATDFELPNLGEQVTGGDVLNVLVKPGDVLAKEQTVLELETDKATIEVPSSVAGKILEVKVKAGDKVKVGQVILTVDSASAGAAAPAPAAPAAAAPRPVEAPAAAANTG